MIFLTPHTTSHSDFPTRASALISAKENSYSHVSPRTVVNLDDPATLSTTTLDDCRRPCAPAPRLHSCREGARSRRLGRRAVTAATTAVRHPARVLACERTARLRVFALRVFASAWLSGQGSSLCVSCVVSCVRCELLAVRAQEPWRVCRLGDVTYTRFAQLGLRLRGSR